MELFKELENMNERIFSIASKSTTKAFHSHKVGQLSVPKNGIMYLTIEDKVYIVPPHMGIFIPKNTQHSIYKIDPHTIIENIYFEKKCFLSLPTQVKTFNLSGLTKALITRLCQTTKEMLTHEKTNNILAVLLDELYESHDLTTYEVVMPHSDGLLKIFNYLINVMDYLPSLDDCANLIHLTPRSLQRKVKQELNIHFILWRQQIIFAKSLALLAEYKKTSIIAYKLGYNSESAFISMFKKMSGQRLPSQF